MRSFIIFAMVICSSPVRASIETHGGNGFIAEFFSIYDTLIQPSTHFCYKELPRQGAEYYELAELRSKLEVQSQPTVRLNGRLVDAINQPGRSPKLVVLSEDRWKRATEHQLKALVLHELIHLLGYREESPNYKFSGPILNCLKDHSEEKTAEADRSDDEKKDSELCQLMKIKLVEESYPDTPSWEDEQTLIDFCGPDWQEAN